MSLAISLNPISRTLHMYGTANTSCSYSLSGSVHLNLSKPPTLFPSAILRPRSSNARSSSTTSVVLTSLVVTFEGKSEHYQEGGVYSATRLCTVSQQLITSPITLQRNDDQPHAAHYDVIFDLTVPGRLPSTFTGTDPTYNAISSTSYSLFATATYHVDTSTAPTSPSLTSTFCNLVQNCNPLSGWSRADKKSHANRVEIEVIRHLVSPPPSNPTERSSIFPATTFSISAKAKKSSPIPNDIISRLQIVASIPNFVASTETSVPISLKARFVEAESTSSQSTKKLAIERVEIDLDQNDLYHSQPDEQYISRFALPSEQPPRHPLLHRSPYDCFEHLGMIMSEHKPKKWVNCHSILDEKAPSSFFLESQDGGISTGEEGHPHVLGTDWSVIKMEATLREGQMTSPTYLSPFLRVSHALNIAIYVNYGDDKDVVQFPLPVNFVELPPNAATQSPSPIRNLNPSRSYEPLFLPAYTQLFHEDGEVRLDTSRGVPPAYRDKLEGEEDGVGEYGRTVKKPELVPVGTTEVDWEAVRGLLS